MLAIFRHFVDNVGTNFQLAARIDIRQCYAGDLFVHQISAFDSDNCFKSCGIATVLVVPFVRYIYHVNVMKLRIALVGIGSLTFDLQTALSRIQSWRHFQLPPTSLRRPRNGVNC